MLIVTLLIESQVAPQYLEYEVFNLMADYCQLKCLTFKSIRHEQGLRGCKQCMEQLYQNYKFIKLS